MLFSLADAGLRAETLAVSCLSLGTILSITKTLPFVYRSNCPLHVTLAPVSSLQFGVLHVEASRHQFTLCIFTSDEIISSLLFVGHVHHYHHQHHHVHEGLCVFPVP